MEIVAGHNGAVISDVGSINDGSRGVDIVHQTGGDIDLSVGVEQTVVHEVVDSTAGDGVIENIADVGLHEHEPVTAVDEVSAVYFLGKSDVDCYDACRGVYNSDWRFAVRL